MIEVADKIHDEGLRRKVLDLLNNLSVKIDGKTYSGMSLEEAPAGISHHHDYPGGLIEHILSSVNIALAMCDSGEDI